MNYKRFKVTEKDYTNLPSIAKIFLSIFDKLFPDYNRISLYILSLSFLTTYFINSEFKEVLTKYGEAANGDGVFLIFMFLCASLLVLISTFVNISTSILKSLFLPIFILVGQVFLTLEYLRIALDSWDIVGIILTIYHGLSLCLLLLLFEEAGNFYAASANYGTAIHMTKIITVSLIFGAVFFTLYYFTDWYTFSWALPITTTLFFASFFKTKLAF
jgi:hypothetical protein